MRGTLILLLIGMMYTVQAQTADVLFRGKVMNEYSAGLAGATVQVSAENNNDTLSQVTDAEGKFMLKLKAIDGYRMTVNYLGYEDQSVPINVLDIDNSSYNILFKMVPAEIPMSIVDVRIGQYHDQELLPSLAHTITIEEVRKLPATFFDPARLAQSLPGVANNSDQANGISIRGNNPDFFKWYLEGVEILNPNHTSNAGTVSDRPSQNAGGVNVLSAQLLSQSQFYKSNFPTGYQNALAGIMGMSLRNGDRNERKHFFQLGLIGLEASSEGPLNKDKKKGTYLFNYRYSTVGLLSNLGLDFGGEKIDFQDLAMNLSYPTKRGAVKVFGVVGLSNNVFTAPENVDEREEQKDNTNINFSGDVGLIGVNFDTYISKKQRLNLTSILSANLVTRQTTPANQPSISLTDDVDEQVMLSTKVSLDRKIKKGNWSYGLYHTWLRYGINSTVMNEVKIGLRKARVLRTGLFTQLDLQLADRWRWSGGVNQSIQTTEAGASELLFEPRTVISFSANEKQSWNFATGLYSQSLAPRTYHLRGSSNNNRVQNIKSWQNELGYTYKASNTEVKVELFYQHLYHVPIGLTRDGNAFSILNGNDGVEILGLNNEGLGRNAGIEMSIRKSPEYEGWMWWLNGTLYRSEYKLSSGAWQSTRFNGQYIFNGILGKEWRIKNSITYGIHGRANYLGGFRETPIDLAASKNEGRTIYVDDKPFTQKQQDYFRIDLSIFRKVVHKKFTSTLSLDIQNLLNRKNEAFSIYDNFLNKVVRRKQLGLLPILNYRIQF